MSGARRTRVTLALAAALALIPWACSRKPPITPEPDASDAQALGDAPGDACSRACASLAAAGCPEALPTKGGETCPELCRRVIVEGHPLPASCLVGVSTPSQARACGVRCLGDGGP